MQLSWGHGSGAYQSLCLDVNLRGGRTAHIHKDESQKYAEGRRRKKPYPKDCIIYIQLCLCELLDRKLSLWGKGIPTGGTKSDLKIKGEATASRQL